MPQKNLQFLVTRISKLFGNTLLWLQSKKNTWGKKTPKCPPSRQKEQFSPKEAENHDAAPGHPPQEQGVGKGAPAAGGTSGARCSSRTFPWSRACGKDQAGKEVLEGRKGPAASPAPEIPSRSFIPSQRTWVSLFSVKFSSTPNPCATPPPSVDTDLKIFKLKNNIITLLSCSPCLYLEAFRGNF